jgi:hypothetical protein
MKEDLKENVKYAILKYVLIVTLFANVDLKSAKDAKLVEFVKFVIMRGWTDSESNESKFYNIRNFKRLNVYDYMLKRLVHVEQVSNEVVALKLICRENGLYKDIFNYIRDRYIFRPVERKFTRRQVKEIGWSFLNLFLVVFFVILGVILSFDILK